MFEAGKRRTHARILKLLPPHLLPDERVRVLALAGGDFRTLRYWLPLAAIGGFAAWSLTRPEEPVVYWGVLLVVVWFLFLVQLRNVRWIVLTDRRFLVLRAPMPSGKGFEVERADPIRGDALAGHYSGLVGRGFVYRTVGGRRLRYRIYSHYLPELAEIVEALRPAAPPPERPDVASSSPDG